LPCPRSGGSRGSALGSRPAAASRQHQRQHAKNADQLEKGLSTPFLHGFISPEQENLLPEILNEMIINQLHLLATSIPARS
jgi:hypothetical protein